MNHIAVSSALDQPGFCENKRGSSLLRCRWGEVERCRRLASFVLLPATSVRKLEIATEFTEATCTETVDIQKELEFQPFSLGKEPKRFWASIVVKILNIFEYSRDYNCAKNYTLCYLTLLQTLSLLHWYRQDLLFITTLKGGYTDPSTKWPTRILSPCIFFDRLVSICALY